MSMATTTQRDIIWLMVSTSVATFVKTISAPQGEMRKQFVQEQESARKDVERAFGALQSRWAIVRHPAKKWSVDIM